MSINKDLNVDPYYDDFDETKQFNRVLFKPARAVQARELTQLQTILQKQVERFGSNVYKEGTIISGINLTARDDLNYIKLQDQVGFTNPAIYDEFVVTDADDANVGTTNRFIIEGETTGVRAEIVKGLNGFETQAPNLKTFFINYLNSGATTKQFAKGEKLNLFKPGGAERVTINNADVSFIADNSNDEYAGKSFGISCEEGVIYQKGHFIFVERQLIIVTRYSDVPGKGVSAELPYNSETIVDFSVGFTVNENIIDSNLDTSLLDNAAGFNNQNAPGADRLQLVPTLVSYPTSEEPTEFFALIRYVQGSPVRIRDFTEFNTISEELAKRTYEESGNYVVDGLEASLESPVTIVNGVGATETVAQVSVSPGKAYVFGKEVRNIATTKLNIDPVTTTQTKSNQTTSVNYGQYYTFDNTNTTVISSFNTNFSVVGEISTYPKFRLYGDVDPSGTTDIQPIGTCNVASIESGKVYVFNIEKIHNDVNDYRNVAPTNIVLYTDTQAGGFDIATGGSITLTNNGELFERSKGCHIFPTGQNNLNAVSSTNLVERVRTSAPVPLTGVAAKTATIATTDSPIVSQPIADASTIFGISNTGRIYNAVSVDQQTSIDNNGLSGITINFGSITVPDDQLTIVYNRTVIDAPADTLTENTGILNTKYDQASGTATLGVPNAIELVSVFLGETTTDDADMVDVTNRFRLVTNAKDAFYDLSYIQLKAGESLSSIGLNANLFVTFKYLFRTTNYGYLTANSYSTVTSKHLINPHTARNIDSFNLIDSYDMRPYKQSVSFPVDVSAGRGSISGQIQLSDTVGKPIDGRTLFANNSSINSVYNYYLNRVDSVVLNEYGDTLLIKGEEAEAPKEPTLNRQYQVAQVFIPGNTIEISGSDAIYIEDKKNTTYTMKDIEELEMKVETLSNLVAMNLAEVNAKSMIVRDANGVERFKNGILADKFSDISGGQLLDPLFSSAVDDTRTIAMPAIREFPIDLKVDDSSRSGVSALSNDFDDVVTLATMSSTVSVINQPYATNFRSCVSNYYSYQGQADIHPKFDSSRDVIKNPDVNFNIDLAGPLQGLVDNLQEFIPLSKEGKTTTKQTSTFVDRVNRVHHRGRRWNVRVRNFVESTPTTRLTSKTSTTKQTLGNFVTDVRMKPFLRAKQIRVLVTGLRPNTRHYFFFDEQDVNEFVVATPRLNRYSSRKMTARKQVRGGYFARTRINARNNMGKAVYSDSKGQLRAIFAMPGGRFFVGENDLEIVDVDQYRSIDSASTSYAKATYRGYTFGLNKSNVNVSTRTIEFDTKTTITTRAFQTRRRDPIAQTFTVRSSSTGGAHFAYVSEIDVYFRRKDLNTGVTCQIREVENGYPTSKVLPFASKMLDSEEVTADLKGTQATTFKFDNPVKLKADTTYCFVIIPDANSPEYLVWTSKVGATSVSKGNTEAQVAVVNDWGDGMLFTSTNDSAWKSYQDEDMKFTLKRYSFGETGTVNLVPNDLEFLTLRDHIHKVNSVDDVTGEINYSRDIVHFNQGEGVYVLPAVTDRDGKIFPMSVVGSELTTLNSEQSQADLPYAIGDYIYMEQADNSNESLVAKIENISDGLNSSTNIEVDTPFFVAGDVNTQLCVFGTVSYYNPKEFTKLHITESSAKSSNFIDDKTPVGFGSFTPGRTYTITDLGSDNLNRATAWQEVMGTQVIPQVGTVFVAAEAGSTTLPTHDGIARENSHVIYGIESGAQANITSAGIENLSYFQSGVLTDDTNNTSSVLDLMKLGEDAQSLVLDKPIEKESNMYCLDNIKQIVSKSEKLRSNLSETFTIRATLTNNGFSSVSPVIDQELSSIDAFQYKITDNIDTSSNWISKEVILRDELPAEGLKVTMNAYRPAGTEIDVYARFVRMEDSDVTTDWIQLNNEDKYVYSNVGNLYDYREFEYNLDESIPSNQAKFNTFQIRIALRHSNSGELDTPELAGITPEINLFPHIFDYTALAVT